MAVPALAEALRDDSDVVRRLAADALGRFGVEAERAVPAVCTLVEDTSPNVRAAAMYALGRIGPSDAESNRALLAALKDEDEFVRYQAGAALTRRGTDFGVLARQLVEAFEREQPAVRAAAARAVAGVSPDDANLTPVETLIRMLHDGNHEFRCVAAMTLAGRGPQAEPATPVLRDAASSDDSSKPLYWCARWALLVLQSQDAKQPHGSDQQPVTKGTDYGDISQ
jgi:HEAT repeat protein